MDVVFVKCKECFFSREAETHIRGFFDKLMTEDKQKMDVTLKSYDLNDLDHPSDRVVVHCAKVQIVIISHHFLQRLKDEAARKPRLSPVNRVFRPRNVICVLLAVTAQEVLDGYEAVLPRFREWFTVDLRSTNKFDPEFCKKFTEQVVRIYNVELSNSSSFSIFPKKVTREQPKITIIFKKPVGPEDEVRIELRTQRQGVVVTDFKMENPHTAMLRIPESLSPDREVIVDVSVFINNHKIGGSRIKSELNLRRADDDEIDRMGKVLPPFLGWLDDHVANTLLKHYKECTDYTTDPELELMNGIIIVKADIMPTIMHFAAYYGLKQTALVVLDEADGLSQCNVKNELNETPTEVAFSRQNDHVGQMLKEYLEISNSYTAYRYIKDLIEKNTENLKEEEEEGSTEDLDRHPVFDPPSEEIEASNNVKESQNNTVEKEASPTPHHEASSPPSSASSEVSCAPSCSSGRNEEKDEVFQQHPTPTARRKDRKLDYYVNVQKPEENPEKVETRDKTKTRSPDLMKKRYPVIQPISKNPPGQDYDIPRLTNQDYKVPPAEIRPVRNADARDLSPVFITKNPGQPATTTASGYLVLNYDGYEETNPPPLPMTNNASKGKGTNSVDMKLGERSLSRQESYEPPNSNDHFAKKVLQPSSTLPLTSKANGVPARSITKGRKESEVEIDLADRQLIELLNDFKEKAIDMRTLETLFEDWKQRPDVIRSMEERMKAVEQLRDDYRKLTQNNNKGSKKSFTFDRIKPFWKRKKSSTSSSPELAHPFPDNKCGERLATQSPTGLVFSGPAIPPHHSPPVTTPFNPDNRDSEISMRSVSIDSRFSDSSVESDKGGSSHSGGSCASSSSASKPPRIQLPSENGMRLKPPASSPIPYEVPPPPRPVKPGKLGTPAVDDVKPSPKPPRKPPPILEEEIPLPSPNIKRRPPPVPTRENSPLDDEPPPLPPPRPLHTTNMFNYVDYKTKKEVEEAARTSPGKPPYENNVMPP